MIKKKVIGGAVALSLVLAGTGYAYWTDALTVSSKVTTGNMQVKFLDLGLYAQYSDEDKGWSIVDGIDDSGYTAANYFKRDTSNYNIIAKPGSVENYKKKSARYHDVSFDANLVNPTELNVNIGPYNGESNKTAKVKVGDGINVSLENIYPGYAQAFRTDIGNVGNVAAKLSKISVESSGTKTGNLSDMIGVALYTLNEESGEHDGDVFRLASNFDEKDTFKVGGVRFVRLSAISKKGVDLSSKIIKKNGKGKTCNELYVDPRNGRMDVCFGYAMDPDAEGNYTTGSTHAAHAVGDDSKSMNKAIKIKMDFGWDQFNEGTEKLNIPANKLANQN